MKQKIFKKISVLFYAILLVLALAGDALAYLDPGTGSYLLQMIFAAVVGALFTIKMYWHKLINFFKKLFGKKAD